MLLSVFNIFGTEGIDYCLKGLKADSKYIHFLKRLICLSLNVDYICSSVEKVDIVEKHGKIGHTTAAWND